MSRKNANLIGRYVWLVDLLRRYGRLTFQQISDRWEESGLSYGEPLVWRTFQNHRDAIFDIFGISIECERKGDYAYYIEYPEVLENDHLRSWLISSMLRSINFGPTLHLKVALSMSRFPRVRNGSLFSVKLCEKVKRFA